MNGSHVSLRLLNDLADDFSHQHFIWQVIALLLCLIVAAVIANAWQRRHVEGAGRFSDASSRLAFPLLGMALSGGAILLLKGTIHVNLLRLAMPLLGSLACVRAIVFVLRQAFPRATWLTAGERVIAAVVWGWLALYITDLAPLVIEALEEVEFKVGKQHIDLWMVLSGATTVFLTLVIALWLAGLLERRLMRLASIDGNLRIVGVRVAKAVLTVVAVFISLSLLGIDVTALSVFTGALGVGLGFGLQKIASNYVSGFIILLDRSIRIGNIIKVGSEGGLVTQITTRYTVLKHSSGNEFIVPNETLIGSTVQNQTYSDSRLRLSTTVGVAYDCDLDLAMRLLTEVAKRHDRVLDDPSPSALLLRFGDSSIELELGFWISDPEGGKGNVVSDINLGIWRAFRENGIAIPFPQREVRILSEHQLPA